MFNFPKILKNRKQESENWEQDIVAENLLEQNDTEEHLDELRVDEGKVTIQFTGASPANGDLLVGFFISNGLKKNIKCINASLVLIDSDRRVLARQTFDGATIGEIVGGSAKACVARFLSNNIYVKDIPADCQVCFDAS
ncbi:SLAP domain-containing protein [Desulfosporosinus hippei]|uniref:SLAP domain-containing protein n=1 Tax=Desulfosporosinus hippei DSM 8344 TaxID=1121419 RepID=A0A1G7U466_9FIRM|nr:SLAP domain-containing protein [Desulfosporosinus hippei]SDG42061.1 SLAP domain-containing protein [Desulfosporosinus hippei DSM 8344]